MDYCDIDYLEQYGGFNDGAVGPQVEARRAMLSVHISEASILIDAHCGRRFGIAVGEAATTRTFTIANGLLDPKYGTTLWLDEDLYTVTSIATVDPLAVLTWLPQLPPYYAIKRDGGAWEDPTTITGFWAYSNQPPATIVNTTARLAMWLYHQRESVQSMGNTVNAPNSIPYDVRAVLAPYKRVQLP